MCMCIKMLHFISLYMGWKKHLSKHLQTLRFLLCYVDLVSSYYIYLFIHFCLLPLSAIDLMNVNYI